MTPKIIFKQRHFTNHRRNTSGSNAQHIRYIATREGVLTAANDNANHIQYIGTRNGTAVNPETANGLFGYVNGAFHEKYDLEKALSYIAKMTTGHRDVFRCMYSFTVESAAEAGLNTLEDWQNWAKFHVSEIANRMNIRISDFEYFAAVHLKEGQPHIHIMYWNLAQRIAINRVDPKICDAIRIDAIKSTYKELFNSLHNREDELLKELRNDVSAEIAKKKYRKTVADKIDTLKAKLPKAGRLVYGYLDQSLKDELNELTHFIIGNNPDFAKIYGDILDTRQLYNELLHNGSSNFGRYSIAKYRGKMQDEIEKAVGNTLLRIMAYEIKYGKEWQPKAQQNKPSAEHLQREQVFRTISGVLKDMANSDREDLRSLSAKVFGNGDLSKEAIRELIIKNRDKVNESGV